MASPSTTSVIVPAFNEGEAIAAVVGALTAGAPWHEVIVVDDGSSDDTAARAVAAGRCWPSPSTMSTCSPEARLTPDFTAAPLPLLYGCRTTMAPADAARLVSKLGDYDLVIGARSKATQATHARRFGNAALNWLAGYLTERPIPDLTSGFRAADRARLLEFLHLLPNGFSTPTTTTMAFIKAGYSVAFEPIEAEQRVGKSKIRLARDGAKFFLILLKMITIFSPLRVFVPVSLVTFAAGSLYAVWTIYRESHVTNSSVLLIMLSVVIFLVGLVSEQISALRFESRQ